MHLDGWGARIRLAELQPEVFSTLSRHCLSNQHHFSFEQEVTAASYQWKPRRKTKRNAGSQLVRKRLTSLSEMDDVLTSKKQQSGGLSRSIRCFHSQYVVSTSNWPQWVLGLNNAAAWHAWWDATGFRRPAFHVINRFCLIPFQDWPSSKCFLWACYMMDAWDKSKNWGNIASGVRSDQRIWATVCSSVYPFLITTAQVPLSNSPMYPLDNEWQPGTM